jgi:hypothetical protein
MNIARFGLVMGVALFASIAFSFGSRSVSRSVWPCMGMYDNSELAELAARSDELDAKKERLYWAIEIANSLAAQLAAGFVSLEDATTRMEPILRERGGFETSGSRTPGFVCPRRATARYLIDKVQQLPGVNPNRLEDVSRRLEAEYVTLR